ncbi:MAG TPA: SGNH/GDSL hydrolase family protein [Bacteroidia bacterium]|jgi:acyl-CoA thioesterase-1|nr:SGNH/GDSL hydrolase family protein [Bacteroidia bacterium]
MRKVIPILVCCLPVIMFLNFKETNSDVVKYIALGDSYTIGTGANPSEAWPNILTKHLNDEGIKTELVANPSKNGFSTQNLIDAELPVFDKSSATFVTLLIGVNDWVRDVNASTYTKNLIYILDHIQKKLPNKKNILLVTIPDFGVTPQGAYYSNDRNVSNGITEFNNIIKTEAQKRGLPVADVFEISKNMKDNTELTAPDGLHPSAKEYAIWETIIFPQAKTLLSK